MDKKSSPLWLVILLSAIIIGLVLLVKSNEYNKTVNSLNKEISRLSQEIELLKQEKKSASPIPQLEFSVKPTATPSSSPIELPGKSNLKTSTNSGERK